MSTVDWAAESEKSPEDVDAAPRRRRRRRAEDDGAAASGSMLSSTAAVGDAGAAAAPRAKTGWGDGTSTSPMAAARAADVRRRQVAQDTEEVTEVADSLADRRRKARNQHFEEESDEVIPVIPDLEEDVAVDIAQQVAVAPTNTARRVQSLRELDSHIKHVLPSATHSGLDLSLLTSALIPQEAVNEGDQVWDFDALLQDISQEMEEEAAAQAAAEAEGENPAPASTAQGAAAAAAAGSRMP